MSELIFTISLMGFVTVFMTWLSAIFAERLVGVRYAKDILLLSAVPVFGIIVPLYVTVDIIKRLIAKTR